jgi:hypothetical protein
MEREKWINEVLNSTNGMTKIAPDDSLFFKIQNKINNNKFSNSWIWVAAASFAILITLNVKFVFGKSNTNKTEIEILSSTIGKSNQLY